MSHSQVNIFIIFITFYLENFNADVAIMMKIWDMATSNQGGRGLVIFVGTMNSRRKNKNTAEEIYHQYGLFKCPERHQT